MFNWLCKVHFTFLAISVSLAVQAQFPVHTPKGYYLMDEYGDTISKYAYQFIHQGHRAPYLYNHNGSFGYLNNYGEPQFKHTFPFAYPFNGNFALAYRNGHFIHINSYGVALDSLDWPKAPLVYKKGFLVVNEGRPKVFNKQGKIEFETKDSLLLGTENGIFEWDTVKGKVKHYISRSGSSLRMVKEYKNVNRVETTQQGYGCIVYNKDGELFFCIPNNRGELLVNNLPDIGYYKHMQVIWDKGVFTNKTSRVQNVGTEYGPVSFFRAHDLEFAHNNVPFKHKGVQVSNLYKNDDMARITHTEKWVQFNGREVEGKYMFDDIAHGFKHHIPVKIERNWYILNRRNDSLISIPYRFVHPSGLYQNVLFVSNDPTDRRNKKWALYKLGRGVLTQEEFIIPFDYWDRVKLYDHQEPQVFYKRYACVQKDSITTYLNFNGDIVAQHDEQNRWALKDYYETTLEIPAKKLKPIQKREKWDKKNLTVQISPGSHILYITVANGTKDSVTIELQDGDLQARLEYERTPGNWEQFSFMPPTFCGNSFYPWKFPAGEKISYVADFPKGGSRIKLRLCLETWNGEKIYSNVVWLAVSFGKIKCKKYYPPHGAISRYLMVRY